MSRPLAPTTSDLAIEDNVADAEHQLTRAELDGSDAAFAAWARAWGRPAIEALREFHDQNDDDYSIEDLFT